MTKPTGRPRGRPRKPRPDDLERLDATGVLVQEDVPAGRNGEAGPDTQQGTPDSPALLNEHDDISADEMILLAGREILRRLKGKEAGQIPATALASLLAALNRMKAQDNAGGDVEEEDNRPVVEMVRDSLLPPERKLELLAMERERLEAELALVNATFDELT